MNSVLVALPNQIPPSVVDIAKVAFITGLKFWLGNAFVLGMGLLSEPEAVRTISELPAWINRSMGLAALAVITAYLAWLLPRPGLWPRYVADRAAKLAADAAPDRDWRR